MKCLLRFMQKHVILILIAGQLLTTALLPLALGDDAMKRLLVKFALANAIFSLVIALLIGGELALWHMLLMP
jgi:uncharacterized membrane protein